MRTEQKEEVRCDRCIDDTVHGYFKSKLGEFKTDEWVENGTECNKAVEILGRSVA